MTGITVVVRLYHGDTVAGLERTVKSLLAQTRRPDEIILVRDPETPADIADSARSYATDYPETVRVHQTADPTNRGGALKTGVAAATHDLVAILDCGDVSVPERLERQAVYLDEHPSVDVVGSYTAEFGNDPDRPHSTREVPTDPADVAAFARFRAPVHQTSVLFRRDAVLNVGNYRELDRMEDYDLWVRMLVADKSIANLPEVLAKAHADASLYARRGGLSYLRREIELQWYFYRIGFVSAPELLRNVAFRAPVRLLPRRARKVVYERLLRANDA